jgi:hypothetical protein
MYRLITSIGAPKRKQTKARASKIFFPKTFVYSRELFFYNADTLLLFALINLLISAFVSALKSMHGPCRDSTAKGDFVDWRYSQRFLLAVLTLHRMTLSRYFTTSTR